MDCYTQYYFAKNIPLDVQLMLGGFQMNYNQRLAGTV